MVHTGDDVIVISASCSLALLITFLAVSLSLEEIFNDKLYSVT